MPEKPPGRKRSGSATDDGTALWRAVTADVKPLPRRPSPAPPPAQPPRAAAPKRQTPTPPASVAASGKPAAPKPVPPVEAGIDKRTETRLRKGRMAIEGRLDLHGMDREAAHRALRGFIAAAYGAGKLCVLVVTGKGKGILQSEAPRWLAEPAMRGMIVSTRPAQPRDGGAGAFYILLKRHRSGRGGGG